MDYVKLGEICEFINGDRGKNYPSGKDIIDSGIPFINAGHLVGGKIDIENMNYISREKFEKLGSGKVKENDILFCLRGSLGKSSICKMNEGAIASSLVILRPNTELVYTKYLMFYLNSYNLKSQIDRANNGSSQPNLSANSVKQFDIYLPKYEEQVKIAEVLEKAQELIDKRKEQIEALDELVKSRFIEMFGDPILNQRGWKKTKLDEVCFKITDGEHNNPEFIDDGIPMVMANNIRDKVDLKNCKYISKEDYDRFSKKCKPEIGDVLLVSRGATIGRCCENTEEKEFSLMGSVILLKNNNTIIEPKFLVNWFKHEGIKKIIYNTSSASAQQAIYMKDLRVKNIILPPMELQNEFAEFVKQVDKLKSQMEISLKELEDNFNCLMQKAFKGELF